MQLRRRTTTVAAGCLSLALTLLAAAGNFPEPANSQPGPGPISAEEAAKSFALPEGFKVSVFAAEPDVRQPIAMTTDPKGRLWVAENYTYGDSREGYQTNYNDRVIVLEDTDHDGHFDKRTVFWDQAKILTSVEVGLGGVFMLCPPQLLFVPDKNGDGIPDGEPEVLLDGFDNVSAGRHTFPNGLKWGPDGWLWGRIGISTGAHVGRPGASPSERVEMRGGIWRYHPQRHVFEAVCHGTTNPWGLDWNEAGEPFFINTVIGHLWHAIPGAHFRRMHGEDVNPHSYLLIDQHADHYHFDTSAGWTKSRADTNGLFAPGSDSLGGGHAHSGLMIYLGENWPGQYRGKLFTLNLHGRRINEDRLERSGSGYVGRHEPDLLSVGDTWFRGLDLIYGPDGGVYISDWSDTGECHENDGVHRTSGRIYKVTYGSPAKPKVDDLTTLPDVDLLPLLFDRNEWYSRQARRVLADRIAAGKDPGAMATALHQLFGQENSPTGKLRAMWALNILGAASPDWLMERTRSKDEYIRSWAVRLLIDWTVAAGHADPKTKELQTRVADRFSQMSREDDSALVRLYLAGAIQRLPAQAATAIAAELIRHQEDSNDHNLGLLIWYGIEPLVAADPKLGAALVKSSQYKILKQLITRRLAESIESQPAPITAILEEAAKTAPADQIPILYGLADALRGVRKCAPPPGWDKYVLKSRLASDAVFHAAVNSLSVVFGDGRLLDDLRITVTNIAEGPMPRRSAIKTLVASRAENLAPLLRSQLGDSFVRTPAMIGLLELGESNAPRQAIAMLKQIDSAEKAELMAALVQRPGSAKATLDAVAAGTLAKNALTPFHARQIASFNDAGLTKQLGEVWGVVRATDAAKLAEMDRLRKMMLATGQPGADLSHGRQIFDRTCASCHRLYGQGRDVGPDLTGSGRANLDYLLSNIADPNALVPAEYRMSVVTLKDGRVLNGIVRHSGDLSVTVATPAEAVIVDKKEIVSTEQSDQSMMPEGLLEGLKEAEARDLLSYLMADHQVALPGQ